MELINLVILVEFGRYKLGDIRYNLGDRECA